MIINARTPQGFRRPIFKDELACPYGLHIHKGDPIEIFLEMIICKDQAEKMIDEMWRNHDKER